ncbi:hypothetical protein BDD30_0069 [Photorhabdus asymbiotica]|uniref:Uncharacterized protein n=1 Tax=Photorhabdus asymbiotica TaxID=291112 RepID=A0ABX9SQP9_9GAMM|nr:hypothetical protein BDD30_0069 [Photorhabdus asymbiotica]
MSRDLSMGTLYTFTIQTVYFKTVLVFLALYLYVDSE